MFRWLAGAILPALFLQLVKIRKQKNIFSVSLRKSLEKTCMNKRKKQQQCLQACKPIMNVSNQLFKMLEVDCRKYKPLASFCLLLLFIPLILLPCLRQIQETISNGQIVALLYSPVLAKEEKWEVCNFIMGLPLISCGNL